MVVKQDNIGDIICRYDNGERFAVRAVAANGLSVQYEDGTCGSLPSCIVDGAIEQEGARIASFQTNLALSRVLASAEDAADRRFVPGQCDVIEQQNASRVTDIVKEQRTHFKSRLQMERRTLKAGRALANQFLTDLIRQGTGTSARFFDTRVQCRGSADHPAFRMNDTADLDRYAAMVYLSDRTAAPPVQAQSFDALVKAAVNRAAQQHSNSHALPDRIDR